MQKSKKVWIEIKRGAVVKNIRSFQKLLRPNAKLFSVVKSNAYGHGLVPFAKIAEDTGVYGFCVDSVVEGLRLRENGIRRPILVLGPTFPNGSLADAFANDIILTISNREALARLASSKFQPAFHLKMDTGMHRQGFYLKELLSAARLMRRKRLPIKGVYTHFASAKDLNYPTFTDLQFQEFKRALTLLRVHGFTRLLRHASATGGTLVNPAYHLDAVRIGIGLYGIWPSRELEYQRGDSMTLAPVLSWKALISEVKRVPKGGYVGYDLAERLNRETSIAIVPIGYWHGFDRGLSSIGEALVRGRRARVLGRVSMDLIALDVTGISVRVGDVVTLIGSERGEEITAAEIAGQLNTSPYEITTRINPLIERVVT